MVNSRVFSRNGCDCKISMGITLAWDGQIVVSRSNLKPMPSLDRVSTIFVIGNNILGPDLG